VSFPCGLEHLRRCTRSTRWWSVDCGTYANRGTLALIIFSWSFPVNWYIQSIHYTPQSKSVTFVSASSPMRNCRLVVVVLYSKPSYLPVASPQCRRALCFSIPFTSTTNDYPPSSFVLLLLLVDPCCRRNTTHLRTHAAHDLYTPTLLFFSLSRKKSFICSLALLENLCTIHSCVLYVLLLFFNPFS